MEILLCHNLELMFDRRVEIEMNCCHIKRRMWWAEFVQQLSAWCTPITDRDLRH
jgi:hypothetical protein